MPEDMPDRMPEDMPDRMPDRMPEDMSDRMPEDLPVTKCINVMVGITRSKVICFFCGQAWADVGEFQTAMQIGKQEATAAMFLMNDIDQRVANRLSSLVMILC